MILTTISAAADRMATAAPPQLRTDIRHFDDMASSIEDR